MQCLMDKKVIPIEHAISNLMRQVDELEWEGKDSKHLQRELDRLLKDHESGHIWEPLF